MHTSPNFPVGLNSINQASIEMQQSQKQFQESQKQFQDWFHKEQLDTMRRMKEFHKKLDDGFTKLITSLLEDPDSVETSNTQADEVEAEIATEEEAVNEDDGVQETKTTTDVGSVCNKLIALEVSLNDNADMWKKSSDQGMLSGNSCLLVVNVIDERVDSYLLLPSFHGLKTLVNERPPTVWINALENVPLHFGIPLRLGDDQHNAIGFEPPVITDDGINRLPPLPPETKFLEASPKVGHMRQLLCSVCISKAMRSNIYLTNFSDHSGWINDLMEINFEEVMEIAVALEGNYDRIQVETTTGLELKMANEFEADKTHTSISYHIFWNLQDNATVFSFILRSVQVYACIKFSFCSASFQLQSSSTLTPFWQQIINTSRTILIEFQDHFSGTLAEAVQHQFNNILATVGIKFSTCPTPFQQYFCNKSRTTQYCISQPQPQKLELIYSTAGNSFMPYQIYWDALMQTMGNKAPKSKEELVEVIGIIFKARNTHFPLTERGRLGIQGLLPPRIISLEQQHVRFKKLFESLDGLTQRESNGPERQWPSAACQSKPGVINYSRGQQPVMPTNAYPSQPTPVTINWEGENHLRDNNFQLDAFRYRTSLLLQSVAIHLWKYLETLDNNGAWNRWWNHFRKLAELHVGTLILAHFIEVVPNLFVPNFLASLLPVYDQYTFNRSWNGVGAYKIVNYISPNKDKTLHKLGDCLRFQMKNIIGEGVNSFDLHDHETKAPITMQSDTSVSSEIEFGSKPAFRIQGCVFSSPSELPLCLLLCLLHGLASLASSSFTPCMTMIFKNSQKISRLLKKVFYVMGIGSSDNYRGEDEDQLFGVGYYDFEVEKQIPQIKEQPLSLLNGVLMSNSQNETFINGDCRYNNESSFDGKIIGEMKIIITNLVTESSVDEVAATMKTHHSFCWLEFHWIRECESKKFDLEDKVILKRRGMMQETLSSYLRGV